ncbi:hypothetical protein [Agrobacterium tumefaciens]|uniref:hypothetical protein n=1 Tax=Agrobacterium tumefaciens TaxID=358 RepID=UPI0021CF57C8|nr:hypothetical protein [Agrobacterium tumefaciens]UXS01088.1 hypothetical protein FY156_06055 [Agrobacterium tumefaciens]
MRDIDDMLPFVLPFAPNCADLTAYRCIREAAREVCEKVDIWREKDTISVTDIDGECLSTFGDAEVKKIEAAALDGIRLEPKSPEWLDANQPGWDGDNENQAQARFITQITPGKIVVVPRMTGTLSVRLILKPSLKAMTLPDFIVDKYATEIGRGAAGRVLMLPNDDGGANPAMATALLSEFNLFLDRLPMMAAKGQQGARPRTKASFY